MHANTDPVKFDFGMADTLVSSFRYCLTSIENQMGERENEISIFQSRSSVVHR